MKQINEKNFQEETKSGKILIDFYADWCGPCRALSPKLEEISKEQTDVIIVKVNVDEDPGLATKFGVRGIPSLVLLKDGVEAGRLMGNQPKSEIENLIKG